LLTAIDTPYADTRAGALSFAVGLPRLDALAVLPVGAPPISVELRLLGASHQVLVGTFSETVACLPGEREPVPGRYRANAGGWAYDFASATVAYDGDIGFRRAVEALRDLLAGREDALTGTFPGSPYAVTALAMDPAPEGFTASPSPVHAWLPWLPEPSEISGPQEPSEPSAELSDASVAAGPRPPRTGWRTWHAYPQTREIVMTRSRLVSTR
jgi:hypothetical protein